jgi:hypothetical protein
MTETMRQQIEGLHLQALGLKAGAAALELSLRALLIGETPTREEAPAALTDAAEDIRRAVQGPTMEERREHVFMRSKQQSAHQADASGTPSGELTPSH